jgi:hypothetical protein
VSRPGAGEHLAHDPAGPLCYRIQRHGPALVLADGGPSNADTLQPPACVLAYQERARRRRAAGLEQMVADAEDAGLYDLPEVPFERLPASDQ